MIHEERFWYAEIQRYWMNEVVNRGTARQLDKRHSLIKRLGAVASGFGANACAAVGNESFISILTK
jgi:hypothetical protein